MCSQSGFLKEITDVFGNSKLYEEAVKAFREMPLAARVDGTMLCVHGGIGPDLMGIDTIQLIMRPIDAYDDPNVEALVWSDPTEKVQEFERSSARGAGFMFGAMALTRFLERSGLNLLVRAHECVADGFEAHHAGRCMTVFSASNYCNSGNRGAVLEVVTAQAYRVRYFAALPFLARKDAIFKGTGKGQMFRSRTQGMQPKIQSPSPGSSPVKRVTIPSSTSATLPPLMPMEFEGDQTQPALQMMRIAQLVGPGRQRRRASCA
jgi:diadenosine tetraphosphatase ApaH/serine/threonine PP2A family protein phosphatase